MEIQIFSLYNMGTRTPMLSFEKLNNAQLFREASYFESTWFIPLAVQLINLPNHMG